MSRALCSMVILTSFSLFLLSFPAFLLRLLLQLLRLGNWEGKKGAFLNQNPSFVILNESPEHAEGEERRISRQNARSNVCAR